MRISDISGAFSAFKNFSLSFFPGLNIIEGENESGKSTVAAFIRAMFYGVPTSERNRASHIAEKHRYRPWDGGAMEGTLTLHTEKGPVTLRRRGPASRPFSEFSADSPPGFPPLTGADAGEVLLGLTRGAYERSAFITSPAFSGGSEGELSDLILNLVSSGEEEVSAGASQALLLKWRNAVKTPRGGELTALSQEISALRRTMEDSRRSEDELLSLTESIASLKDERTLLLSESARFQAEERERETLLVHKRAALEHAEERVREAPPFLLPEGLTATKDALEALPPLLSLRRERKREVDAARALALSREEQVRTLREELSSLPFHGLSPEEVQREMETASAELSQAERRAKRFRWLLPAIAPLPVVIAAVIFLAVPGIRGLPAFFAPLFVPATIASLVLTFVLLSLGTKAGQRRTALFARFGVRDRLELRELFARCESAFFALHDAEAELHALRSRLSEMPEEPLPPMAEALSLEGPPEEMERQVFFALTALSAYEKLLSDAQRLRTEFEAAESAPPKPETRTENAPPPRFSKEETLKRLSETEGELKSAELLRASLEGAASASSPGGDLSEKLSALLSREAALTRRLGALSIALETLKEADERMRERFSPGFHRDAAEIFSFLTGGKYSQVFMSREFEVSALGEHTTGQRRALELSTGAADQAYFAVRLAICRQALKSLDPPPLILDDALLTFDDKRLSLSLELLLREAKTRQVLLFTCHTRERRLLTGREGVNFLHIS